MIGTKPSNLPKREYTPYTEQTADELGEALLRRRNPLAQSSVSALKDVAVCRRMGFLKAVIGLTTPQHPKAAAGTAMHGQVERWYKGGPLPEHPSLLFAIDAELLPKPSTAVRSEEEFWLPTGVDTPTSPDGQLWLRGFMDIIYVPEPGKVRILDMKTKDSPEYCRKYSVKPADLVKDEQAGIYGHVFHSAGMEPVELTFGHLNMARDVKQPYAKLVQIPLAPTTARTTYLRVLDTAELAVADSQCGDWQAVPGNFAKCEKPFRCAFVPLCHGRTDLFDMGGLDDVVGDADLRPKDNDMNPYTDKPPSILPPDAAPPGAWTPPDTKTKTPKALETTMSTDLDSILNSAMGKTPATAPAVAAPKPAAVAPPKQPEGDTDASALDALLGGTVPTKVAPISKPVTAVPAAPPPPLATQALPGAPAPAPAPALASIQQPVAVATTTPAATSDKPIRMLCVQCRPEGAATNLFDLIAQADRLIVEQHNKQPGVSKIHSMMALDHGAWRGPFAALLPKLLPATPGLVVVATGDSPAVSTGIEILTPLASERIWGGR